MIICSAFRSWLLLGLLLPGGSVLAAEVDSTIVLRIGPLAVSRYAIEKNLDRARDDSVDAGLTESSSWKTRWFSRFLAQQVVIAQALHEGYADRAEVRAIVDDMERYMLSQSEGPFYQSLYSNRSWSEEDLREAYARTAFVYDVLAIRSTVSDFSGLFGSDWAKASTAERIRRIERIHRSPLLVVHDGPLPWPYDPVPEIDLGSAAPGEWIERRDNHILTTAYVRSVEKQALIPFETAREWFEHLLIWRGKVDFRRQRRAELLRSSNFVFHREAAEPLLRIIQMLPPGTRDIPGNALQSIATTLLASYDRDGAVAHISVSAWGEAYNRLLVRRFPDRLDLLRTNVADLVMVELDCLEARRRGIDQTPRFVEDRRNFSYHQILGLFEKERLQPKIVITDAEIAQHYDDHRSGYEQPTRARGTLLLFNDDQDAVAWIREHPRPLDSAASIQHELAQAVENVEVSLDRHLQGFEQQTNAILHAPPGQTFGPVLRAERWAVFLKQSTDREMAPLVVVKERVRMQLTRQRLDEEEIRLAREWSGRFAIEDKIPYAELGFEEDRLSTPWRESRVP